jgi:hypothetical protein
VADEMLDKVVRAEQFFTVVINHRNQAFFDPFPETLVRDATDGRGLFKVEIFKIVGRQCFLLFVCHSLPFAPARW